MNGRKGGKDPGPRSGFSSSQGPASIGDSDRKHLTNREVERLIEAAKGSRNEARDRCLLLLVFRHGLQLFGAMGFTWENDLQFALKRAKAGELMLGGAAEHRATIAEEYKDF